MALLNLTATERPFVSVELRRIQCSDLLVVCGRVCAVYFVAVATSRGASCKLCSSAVRRSVHRVPHRRRRPLNQAGNSKNYPRPRRQGRALKFPFVQVDTVFTSKTVQNIGPGDGGGPDITGTFKALIVPSLRDSILKKGAQEKCGKVLTGGSTSMPPPPESFGGAAFVSFFYPGQEGSNDWVTWIGGIDYVDGKPYCSSLQRYHWEV
jgi:hypothetical protein